MLFLFVFVLLAVFDEFEVFDVFDDVLSSKSKSNSSAANTPVVPIKTTLNKITKNPLIKLTIYTFISTS